MNGSARARSLLVTAGLLGFAWLASMLALIVPANTHEAWTAAWWPAAGVGVTVLLLAPRHRWPILLTALWLLFWLANTFDGRSLGVGLQMAVVDTFEVWLIGLLVVRYIGRRLTSFRDIWLLFSLTVAGASVYGVLILLVADLFDGHTTETLLGVIIAHASAVMLVVPLVMSRPPLPGQRRAELTAQASLFLIVAVVCFCAQKDLTLLIAPLPLLIWAAVRFGERAVAVEQAALAVVISVSVQAGWGPFFHDTQGSLSPSVLAQVYLVGLVMTGLPLAFAVRHRELAMELGTLDPQLLRQNFTDSRVPIALLSWDGHELVLSECNAAATAILGQSRWLRGTPVTKVLHSGEPLSDRAREISEGVLGGWNGDVEVLGRSDRRIDAILSLVERSDGVARFSLHLLDVTDAHEMRARLEMEKDYTRAVLDTANSMIVVTSLDGTVLSVNPATTKVTGYTATELVGRPFWTLLATRPEREVLRQDFERGRLPAHGEAMVQRADGSRRVVAYSNGSFDVPGGESSRYVLTGIDITAERESDNMVRHLLRSATTVAFVSTDLQGNITHFNSGAEHMLAIRGDLALGRNFAEFLPRRPAAPIPSTTPPAEEFAQLVAQVARHGQPETRDWTWLRVGKPPMKVSMTTSRVTDSFGHPLGYLFVARDVTESRRSRHMLVKTLRREREAVSRLKALDRAKDDFVTTVSHELRTPMSSIIGGAEMLNDGLLGDLSAEQEQMVRLIRRNGDRLLGLADDLLALAGQDHDPSGQYTRLDLRGVAEQCLIETRASLGKRAVHLDLRTPPCEVTVTGDSKHLSRAVSNLLTNAVKFTPDNGTVSLTIEVDDSTHEAILSVTDTGIGIPAEEIDEVFERFYRASSVQEQAIQGSGLGLAIVKSVVERHAGQIEVTSTPGRGSTFTMRLPLT